MFFSSGHKINCIDLLIVRFIILSIVFTGCKNEPENAEGVDKLDPRSQALQYLQQNRLDEAEASFVKAIQVEPANVLNHSDLALLYLLQKDYSAAGAQAREGLKLDANNSHLKLILAEVYDQKGNKEDAEKELKNILGNDPRYVKAYFKLAEMGQVDQGSSQKKNYLIKLTELVPANIVPRLQLAELLAADNRWDSSLFYLEGVRKIAPDFSATAAESYQKAVSILKGNQPAKAMPYIRHFHQMMKITREYAYGTEELEGPQLLTGYSEFTTSQLINGNKGEGLGSLDNMKFTDASESVGLILEKAIQSTHSTVTISDYDSRGDIFVYVSFLEPGATDSKYYLFQNRMGSFKECKATAGLNHKGQEMDAIFTDYDNDGFQDLFIVTSTDNILYKNKGDGTFSKPEGKTGLEGSADGNKVISADLDQDGDLDLYIARKGVNEFFRNNNDETFTQNAGAMGLTGSQNSTIDLDFGDFDSDGDQDIVALNEDGSIQLFSNQRHSKFKDIAGSLGLLNSGFTGTAIAVGDYNNDGLLDIFLAGNRSALFTNSADKGFTAAEWSKQFHKPLEGVTVHDANFLDFDNDGHQDLLVTGVNKESLKRGLHLFHNDTSKGFSDVSYLLPENAMQGHYAAITDFNLDGDEDFLLAGPSGIQLMRNDGGNLNQYIQVQLIGLSYGNSKNNRLGIGAQVELKAGDLYQLKTVTGPQIHFGVGTRDSLDAVRIIWPNGVPQVIADPSRRERLIEEEKMKGSCPFLYTWNGKEFEFVKDMLWRSALGMPLAINGKDTTFAFSDASEEYLLIPGEKLKAENGRYSIKITEELWEAVYFDKLELVAVDHPDSVDVYVDERFILPPFPGRDLYLVSAKHLPVAATSEKGANLLSKISAYDFQYVSNFSSDKYQGLAENHDLILDLGDKAMGDSLYLFLRGWVYPTDASINMALTQTKKFQIHPPSLQVINKRGEWETVISNLGYPLGKDKMVIASLSGKFLTANDRRVKISTNMQIYWDHIFFTTGNAHAPVKMHDLKMLEATLNFRGYSASYHKGGANGPHWFDYYNITTGQKWRDLTGNYTRYGDVIPLLQKGDDQYIIANSGDEIAIEFDAAGLPGLPRGWKRDFLIYSEGWVKDGDLNTAHGQTVEPLPFHRMPAYPYGSETAYPSDEQHRKYRQKYNTRKVSTSDFKNALKPGAEVAGNRR